MHAHLFSITEAFIPEVLGNTSANIAGAQAAFDTATKSLRQTASALNFATKICIARSRAKPTQVDSPVPLPRGKTGQTIPVSRQILVTDIIIVRKHPAIIKTAEHKTKTRLTPIFAQTTFSSKRGACLALPKYPLALLCPSKHLLQNQYRNRRDNVAAIAFGTVVWQRINRQRNRGNIVFGNRDILPDGDIFCTFALGHGADD